MERKTKSFVAAVLVLYVICLLQSITNHFSSSQMGPVLGTVAQPLSLFAYPFQLDVMSIWWVQGLLEGTPAEQYGPLMASAVSTVLLLLACIGLVTMFQRVKWWDFLLRYVVLSLLCLGMLWATLNPPFDGPIAMPVTGLSGDHDWVPIAQESAEQQIWRSESPTRFLAAVGDFDGDGHPDAASLVASADGEKSAVRICWGGPARQPSCSIAAAGEFDADVMGLSRRAPGCYAYHEDDDGQPSRGNKVCTRADALEYFRFGSSSSFFVVEAGTGQLVRYWDSD